MDVAAAGRHPDPGRQDVAAGQHGLPCRWPFDDRAAKLAEHEAIEESVVAADEGNPVLVNGDAAGTRWVVGPTGRRAIRADTTDWEVAVVAGPDRLAIGDVTDHVTTYARTLRSLDTRVGRSHGVRR